MNPNMMIAKSPQWLLLLVTLLPALPVTSCASSGTEPQAMTAAQHEAAAQSEERAGKEHGGKYDPSQAIVVPPTVNCPFYGGSAYGGYGVGAGCYGSWTSIMNPTAQHLAEGKRHAELAAKHRAASKELRDAEARSCKNVPAGDRDISPFYHRDDIVFVGPLKKLAPSYENAVAEGSVIGAGFTFAALPGMTAEWLQRVVDCHLARNAVLADAADEMPYCPLAVPHAIADVHSVGNGFAVDVTSEDDKSAKEILARAQRLPSKASR